MVKVQSHRKNVAKVVGATSSENYVNNHVRSIKQTTHTLPYSDMQVGQPTSRISQPEFVPAVTSQAINRALVVHDQHLSTLRIFPKILALETDLDFAK